MSTRLRLGRVAAISLAAGYTSAWAGSLFVALQDHSGEVLGPGGHGTFETAVMTLIAITQPLGLLAAALIGSATSGRAGIILFWGVAGILGAIQWTGIAVVGVLLWRHFHPDRSALDLR